MPILDTVFLSNTLRTWIIAAGVALAGYLALTLLLAVVRNRLGKLAAQTRTQWDDILVFSLGKTSQGFLAVLALSAGSGFLELPTRVRTVIQAITVLALAIQGGVWLSASFSSWFAAYAKRGLESHPRGELTVTALAFAVRVTIWSIIVLVALDNLGIDISALVAGLGIGGIAIALAAQNILGDLFASLSILLDKPFVLGDYIVVDDHQGTVEKVGVRTTRIRSLGGEQIVFSNTDLIKSRVRNYGRMVERRVAFPVAVVYQTPRDQLRRVPEILRETIEAQPGVRFERAHLKEYGDFGIRFEAVYFVLNPDFKAYMDIQQAVNLRLYEVFESEGLQFAYPGHAVLKVVRGS